MPPARPIYVFIIIAHRRVPMAKQNMTPTINIQFRGEKGRFFKGTLSLDGHLGDILGPLPSSNQSPSTRDNQTSLSISSDNIDDGLEIGSDYDAAGASTFVIAVILLYGFSMVLLISSQVFNKKKAHLFETDKSADQYLQQAAALRRESNRESFAKLKMSLIPAIASSPSGRNMIANNAKYAPFLLQYIPKHQTPRVGNNVCEDNRRAGRTASMPSTIQLSNILEQETTKAEVNMSIQQQPEIYLDVKSDFNSNCENNKTHLNIEPGEETIVVEEQPNNVTLQSVTDTMKEVPLLSKSPKRFNRSDHHDGTIQNQIRINNGSQKSLEDCVVVNIEDSGDSTLS